MKKEDIKPFFEAYEDDFFNSMNDVKKYLKDNNEEYKKIYKELHNILEKNKNLSKFFDEEISENGLKKEECFLLSEIINLYYKLQEFEEKEIYFKGGMDTYFYFKNIKILK